MLLNMLLLRWKNAYFYCLTPNKYQSVIQLRRSNGQGKIIGIVANLRNINDDTAVEFKCVHRHQIWDLRNIFEYIVSKTYLPKFRAFSQLIGKGCQFVVANI